MRIDMRQITILPSHKVTKNASNLCKGYEMGDRGLLLLHQLLVFS